MYKKENHVQFKSYLLYIVFGLAAGMITRLSDFFPNDDLWSLSSIATLFGFWMVTVTLVIYFSSSNINAAINVFVYLTAMNFSFYFLNYVLGFFVPMFDNEGFQWSLFIFFTMFALVCSVISYVLYFWNKENKWSNVLYALPVSGLAAETIGVSIYLYNNHTFLFQLIFNSVSLIILGYWFYRKANNKWIYIATIGMITLIGYFLVYYPFL
ncbi:hypothetical protein BpOF4_17240 [Alkalihalophilus pseudofirmus OF4]|uniref:Uncharacterized protein n=1 Tax=Alkalihalophilus pseudofirmus (strain ATCC BAA-2126 / JCM 17055 / OF4) TaxID=398511 RepID=D3FQW9_ALKPO|nr:hypothetical protein [Alkalihalophilus pseudofirmus]ADC51489.1 hypothetical protein BpOF4_17240 [Alkalihalophilus pseudofirmus OF4]